MKNARLQSLLVERALVSADQLEDAIHITQGTGCTWVEHLLITNLLDEESLCRTVADAAWVERCNPERLTKVSRDVLAALPSEVAIEHNAVPLGLDPDGELQIAMLDPTCSLAMEELAFFANRPLVREVAPATAIAWAHHHYYGARSALWPRTQRAQSPQYALVA